jgi:hypothetical protein
MNLLDDDSRGVIICITTIIFLIIFAIGGVWGLLALSKSYTVWSQSKTGQAELARADWNRQIAVREAKAKEESAVLLARAEVERAKGVAQANKIIGDSLNNNEAYLKYLWINNLHEGNNSVVYVPTETNLPILEANRFKSPSY